ncbi:MAG: hypothetical protein U0235_24265 [Polyangiaceae bacterium]
MARTKTVSDDRVLDVVEGRPSSRPARVHACRRLGEGRAITRNAPPALRHQGGARSGLRARRAANGPVLDWARFGPRHPLRALRRALRAVASALGGTRGLRSSIALFAEDVRDPALRRSARRHATRLESEIVAALRAARTAGELERRAPVGALARQLVLVWNGALTAHALGGRGGLAPAVDAALRFALGPYVRRVASR